MKLFSLMLFAVAALSMGSVVVEKAHADDSAEKCRRPGGCGDRGGNGGGGVNRPRPTRPTPGDVNRPRPTRPTPGDVNRPRPNRPVPDVNRPRPNRPVPDVNRPRPNRPVPDVNRPRPNRPVPDVNRPRPNRPVPDVNRPRPNRPVPDVNRPRPNHPRPDVNRPRPHRPDYTRPRVPTQPRYRRPVRRTTWDISWGWRRHQRHHHRPLWWMPSYTYTTYHHVPYRYNSAHHNRWMTGMYYHYTLPYRFIYWNRWVRVRHQHNNGYLWHDNYPWFVYNGYRHRYSQTDRCDYELVDGFNNRTERTFHTYSCSVGYDMCADQRDRLNQYENNYRYFCSETFNRDPNYNYSWDYSDDFWSDANESQDYGSNEYDDYDFGQYDQYDDYVSDSGSDDYYDDYDNGYDDGYSDDYSDDYGWEDDWDYN